MIVAGPALMVLAGAFLAGGFLLAAWHVVTAITRRYIP